MLIHPTVERLRALGLTAMADAFLELQNAPDASELSREDWLGLLVDREATSRENKRLARRLREARLRQSAVVEDVDFRAHRGLDRALFLKLATCQWIRDHHHLALVGPTGIGKSWLACALGHKACREGFSVLYKRASRLFTDLAQARGEGRLPRLMSAFERHPPVDHRRLGPGPLKAEQRRRTYCNDTVVRVPPAEASADRQLMREDRATAGGGLSQGSAADDPPLTPGQKRGAATVPPLGSGICAPYCDGQIFQITPVPGIWTSGPLAAPTKCVSEPLSRTAP